MLKNVHSRVFFTYFFSSSITFSAGRSSAFSSSTHDKACRYSSNVFSFYKIFTKPLKKRAGKGFEVIIKAKYDAHRIEIFLQLCFYHVYPPAPPPGPTLHPPLQRLVRQDRKDFSIFRKKPFICFSFKLLGQDFTLACIFRVAL